MKRFISCHPELVEGNVILSLSKEALNPVPRCHPSLVAVILSLSLSS
jgi:hypothetical protein